MLHKYCIIGYSGKLGGAIVAQLQQQTYTAVSSKAVISSEGIHYRSKEQAIKNSQVVIDVSTVQSAIESAKLCQKLSKPIVIGVTGFSQEHIRVLEAIAKDIPLMLCANFSEMMNLLFSVVKKVTTALKDTNIEVQIEETHRKDKLDKPSGTALQLQTQIQAINPKQQIAISSHRIADKLGQHKVAFQNNNELIQLTHTTIDRSNYAVGAIKLANWLLNQPAGWYDSTDGYRLKD